MEEKVFLYKLYHEHTGALVYIGVTKDTEKRLYAHLHTIFRDVPLRMEICASFDTRKKALKAEKIEIKKNRPTDNILSGHNLNMFRAPNGGRSTEIPLDKTGISDWLGVPGSTVSRVMASGNNISAALAKKINLRTGISVEFIRKHAAEDVFCIVGEQITWRYCDRRSRDVINRYNSAYKKHIKEAAGKRTSPA